MLSYRIRAMFTINFTMLWYIKDVQGENLGWTSKLETKILVYSKGRFQVKHKR